MSEIRIRGRVYQIDEGDLAGKWTYFIRLSSGGADVEHSDDETVHASDAFATKQDALRELEKHVRAGMIKIPNSSGWIDNKTGLPA